VSRRGLYGDVIEEIDGSVGRILEAIRAAGIAEETVVFFTSDNGPWLPYGQQGGSAGLLRDGKGSTWEGGMREPFLAWWPGTIPAGQVVRDLGATMDLYVTSILLAGGTPPADRVLDGVDLRPAFFGTGPSPRDSILYYRGTDLYAVRLGPYKAHFLTQQAYGGSIPRVEHDPPVLYHLEHDPAERFDLSADHPEVIASIRALADAHRQTLEPVPNQLETRLGAE
jgi:arylsulfatase A-like enzyme